MALGVETRSVSVGGAVFTSKTEGRMSRWDGVSTAARARILAARKKSRSSSAGSEAKISSYSLVATYFSRPSAAFSCSSGVAWRQIGLS